VALDLSLMLVKFGINQAVIKHKTDLLIKNGAFALILIQALMILIIAGVLFIGYYSLAPEQAIILLSPGLFLVCTRIFFHFSTLVYAPIEGDLQYKFLTSMRLIATLSGLLVAVIVLLNGGGIYTLVVRHFVTSLLLLILVWYRVRPDFSPDFSSAAIKPVWKFSIGIWGHNILENGALRLDYALVGVILGMDALGIYYQVRAIIEGVLNFLVSPIHSIIYSFYCRYTQRISLFKRLIKQTLLLVLPLATISILIMILSGKPLISLILGEKWISGGSLLPGLMLYAWSILWYENIKIMAISENCHYSILWSRVLQIITLALLVVPLTNKFEFIGTGAATGLAALLLASYSTVLLSRRLVTKTP
jgi:O-antigen/teichoic acid export membrane protein